MNIPLNIDWQQILLHMLNFVILFAILYFVLYKPVKNFMAKRDSFYKDMDDKAKMNLAESEKIKAEYTAKLSAVDSEISEKRKESENVIEKTKTEIIANANKKAESIITEAKELANKEHDAIISRANNEIFDIVSIAAEKMVFKNTNDAYETFLNNVESDSNE